MYHLLSSGRIFWTLLVSLTAICLILTTLSAPGQAAPRVAAEDAPAEDAPAEDAGSNEAGSDVPLADDGVAAAGQESGQVKVGFAGTKRGNFSLTGPTDRPQNLQKRWQVKQSGKVSVPVGEYRVRAKRAKKTLFPTIKKSSPGFKDLRKYVKHVAGRVQVAAGSREQVKVKYVRGSLLVKTKGLKQYLQSGPAPSVTVTGPTRKSKTRLTKSVEVDWTGKAIVNKLPAGKYVVSVGSAGQFKPKRNSYEVKVSKRSKQRLAKVKVKYQESTPAPTPTPTPPPAPKPDWDPKDVAPLPMSAGGEGSGPPVYRESVVTQDQGSAVSLQPKVKYSDSSDSGQYRFSFFRIGDKNPFRQLSSSNNSVRIPTGMLTDSTTYEWTVQLPNGDEVGRFVMSVDSEAGGKQVPFSVGPFSVGASSGSLSTSAGLGGVAATGGDLSLSASYLAGAAVQPGMVPGWQVAVSGVAWQYVKVTSDGEGVVRSVELTTPAGTHIPYKPSGEGGAGAFEAVLPAGQKQIRATAPLLVQNPDGSFTATNMAGAVFTFKAADADGFGWLQRSYSGLGAGPVHDYDQGRVRSVTDSISGMRLDAYYQGDAQCPAVPEPFVTPPTGMLCATGAFDQIQSYVFYRRTDAGQLVLARVVGYPDTNDAKPLVTDFGYDQGGRLVAYRGSLAVNAIAAGVRSDTAAVQYDVTYDQAGRAAKLTSPAAQAGWPREWAAVSYDTTHFQTTVTTNGSNNYKTGFAARVAFEQNSFATLKKTSNDGQWLSTQWDDSYQQVQSTLNSLNQQMTAEYDENGWLNKSTGPWPKGEAQTDRTPYTEHAYDQSVTPGSNVVKDMEGFSTFYWTNAELSGVPAGRSSGPQIEGNIPSKVQWSWPQPPVGQGDDAWSARMLGVLQVPANGVYDFQITPKAAATLWVNGVQCETGTCTGVPLGKGPTSLRIDAAASDGGPLSTALKWGKTGEASQVMDMKDVKPGYGVPSQSTTPAALSTGASQSVTSQASFPQPWNGVASNQWTKQASDMQFKSVFNAISQDPKKQEYGQLLSSTLGNGTSKIVKDYWGVDEQATPPCEDMSSATQHGMPKTVTSTVVDGEDSSGTPGGTVTATTWFDEQNRSVASQTENLDPFCIYHNDIGEVTKATYPARGDSLGATVETFTNVGGNPMVSRSKLSNPDTLDTISVFDLAGNRLLSVNSDGTSVQNTYDPATGNLTQNKLSHASGYASVTSYSYDPDGKLAKVSRDDQTLATITRTSTTSGTIEYFNGVEGTFTVNPDGSIKKMRWLDANGKSFSYENGLGVDSKILTETFMYGSKQADYEYTYDILGRLVKASLDTTNIDVSARDWAYEFEGEAGLNSNRTRQVVDGEATTYTYNSHDQLISASDPSIGDQIEYSNLGEITRLGNLEISYNAASNPIRVTDTKTGDQITYSYNTPGGGLTGKTVTKNGQTTTSAFAAQGLILNGEGQPVARNTNLPGEALWQQNLTDTTGASDTVSFYTARGNEFWTADHQGLDTGHISLYSPYGERVTEPSAPTNPFQQHFGFLGASGIASDTVGIDQINEMGQRLYLPKLGRFTSIDPIRGGSANAYDYANQDPINQADPSGNFPVWGKILVAIGIAALTAVGMYWADAGVAGLAAKVGVKSTVGVAALTLAAEALVNAGLGVATAAIYSGGKPSQASMYMVYGQITLSLFFGGLATSIQIKTARAAEQMAQLAAQTAEATATATAEAMQPLIAQTTQLVQDTEAAAQRLVPQVQEAANEVIEQVQQRGNALVQNLETTGEQAVESAKTAAVMGCVLGGTAYTLGAPGVAGVAVVGGLAYLGYTYMPEMSVDVSGWC
ncbi:PA14 domain-containing protein [Candidatus Nanopelagicales bacterium]|nr:PA14 domain-containing protein [Candidatus Nanopelagicales bacterium]